MQCSRSKATPQPPTGLRLKKDNITMGRAPCVTRHKISRAAHVTPNTHGESRRARRNVHRCVWLHSPMGSHNSRTWTRHRIGTGGIHKLPHRRMPPKPHLNRYRAVLSSLTHAPMPAWGRSLQCLGPLPSPNPTLRREDQKPSLLHMRDASQHLQRGPMNVFHPFWAKA